MKKDGQFKIETGIPVPPHPRNKGHTKAVRALKKGESVLLPVKIHSISSILRRFGFSAKTHVCRTVEGGVRIWRIA